jgi:hypothetical protein
VRWASLTCSLLPLFVLTACGGGGSTSDWKNLQAVRVTVARPGLPPPGGFPHTTSFTSQRELALVTAALNTHHIAKARTPSPNDGCAGGQTVAISITRADGGVTNLSAYRCAGKTTGNITGDLAGFLSATRVAGATT